MGFSRKRKRADGRPCYQATYIDPEGKQRAAGTYDTKREADEAWKIAEGRVRNDTWLDPKDSRQTFLQYVEQTWWPNQQHLELTTRKGYRSKLNHHLLPTFGDTRMDRLRHSVMQSYVGGLLKGGHSPANIRAVFRVLNLIMRSAVRDRVLDANPCADVKLPTVPRRRWNILDPVHADRFEATLLSFDHKWQVMILLELGARFSELRALRPRHINFLRGWVRIEETVGQATEAELDEEEKVWAARPESERRFERIGTRFYRKPYTKEGRHGEGGRTVSVAPEVMRLVELYVADNGIGPDELIFTNGEGSPIDHSNFHRDVWKPLLEQCDLDLKLRPHDLRHSVASWNLKGGADLAEVMEAMGHSQISTTQLYLHTTADASDNVMAARRRLREGRRAL
jgi:integrase